MVCIYCGSETKVTNSRERQRNPSVWRRRRCKDCVAQFTTVEAPDYSTAVAIVGRDEGIYPFVRDRLFISLFRALGHRNDALSAATELTETVIGKLFRGEALRSGMLHAHLLAQCSYETLKRFDPLAAGSYKAYHQAALKRSSG